MREFASFRVSKSSDSPEALRILMAIIRNITHPIVPAVKIKKQPEKLLYYQ
jgi:hypothetical protein